MAVCNPPLLGEIEGFGINELVEVSAFCRVDQL